MDGVDFISFIVRAGSRL